MFRTLWRHLDSIIVVLYSGHLD